MPHSWYGGELVHRSFSRGEMDTLTEPVVKPEGVPDDPDYEKFLDRFGVPIAEDMPAEAQRILKLLHKAKITMYRVNHRYMIKDFHPTYNEWGTLSWHKALAELEDRLEEIIEVIKEWGGET